MHRNKSILTNDTVFVQWRTNKYEEKQAEAIDVFPLEKLNITANNPELLRRTGALTITPDYFLQPLALLVAYFLLDCRHLTPALQKSGRMACEEKSSVPPPLLLRENRCDRRNVLFLPRNKLDICQFFSRRENH